MVHTNGGPNHRYEARINRAIALIDARIDERLSLDDLASEACLSRYHFHRIFHALVGETVNGFTTRLRLERALRLARSAPMEPWQRIAAAVGYRSLPVFSRAFKRHYGCSPANFDLVAHWATRPDVQHAHAVSSYFLRPPPSAPDDFRVDLIHRPAIRRVVSRAWGAYVDPTALTKAYARLVVFADQQGLPTDQGRLAGASRDDPEITPLSRCRYDFSLEVEDKIRLTDGLSLVVRPAGWWAAHAVQGDIDAVDRAWNLLFKAWLPAAACNLRNEPAEEVYRQLPADVGWERFDLLCCIPVEYPYNH